jgi:hypothetical protein
LTTLAPQAGDLLIAICVQYQGGTANAEFGSWGASFTELADLATATALDQAIGVAYKIATGSETGTFTVTSAHSFKSVNFLMRIPRATWAGSATIPEVQAATRATNAAANPAAFDPANWAAEDTLWIAVAGFSETSTTGSPPTLDTPPTNYSGQLIVARAADAVGDITAGVAFRQVNASSEDVGTWGVSNPTHGNGIATLIAVRPAASDTTTIAGATAGGPAPTVTTTATIAGAQATSHFMQGSEIPVTIAGATAGGFAPTEDIASGGSDNVPQGGALAGGNAPTAQIAVAQGGALADGQAATTQVTVAQGGASAGGASPTIQATLTINGALAGGASPTSGASLTISGALAGGQSPNASTTLVISGALAGGASPTSTSTLTAGGALAAGQSPTSRASLTITGAVAGGASPNPATPLNISGATANGTTATAFVNLTIGGALAGGVAPGQSTPGGDNVPQGGADVGGNAPGAAVTFTISGALAGGTTEAASATFTISGALAGGYEPSESIAGASDDVPPGGALADGTAPTGVLVSLTIDGALARGFSPTQPGTLVMLEGIATGRIGRGWTGGRGLATSGEVAQAVTGISEEDDQE